MTNKETETMSTLIPSAFVAALALGAFLAIQPMLERLA